MLKFCRQSSCNFTNHDCGTSHISHHPKRNTKTHWLWVTCAIYSQICHLSNTFHIFPATFAGEFSTPQCQGRICNSSFEVAIDTLQIRLDANRFHQTWVQLQGLSPQMKIGVARHVELWGVNFHDLIFFFLQVRPIIYTNLLNIFQLHNLNPILTVHGLLTICKSAWWDREHFQLQDCCTNQISAGTCPRQHLHPSHHLETRPFNVASASNDWISNHDCPGMSAPWA